MTDQRGPQVSSAYAWSQLTRAVAAAGQHPEADARGRAAAKVATWRRIIDGMADGTLRVGSRTPVADTPAWVTLEVAHGGFATGRFLAEQPLREDEIGLLRSLGPVPGETDRERLNVWYLTDVGQAVLAEALATGRYRIDVPEEAALLVVTWLLGHGQPIEAMDLITELRPLMHRLRFTPTFVDRNRPEDAATVRLETVAEVSAALSAVRVPEPVARMRATLGVWHPLFDRLLALWCDTVEGELPRLAVDRTDGLPGPVEGGWPCRRWPQDWAQRRSGWLADYRRALDLTARSGRQQSPKSDFARLAEALNRCEQNSDALTGREVGWIRRAMANTITRHGGPGSLRRSELRATQEAAVAAPTHAAVAQIVVRRLHRYPPEGGVPSLDPVVTAVADGEDPGLPTGTAIPPQLTAKAQRALEAPVAELVARGIIGSGEVLARVLPQISRQIVAADLNDPRLSALCRQTYTAFRRRRSLLLVDYQSQVRFEELPWMAAIEPLRSPTTDLARTARTALQEATVLALAGFPHAILPNPLVTELRALAQRAGLNLPLVPELAADIFMGSFTNTWRRAAVVASTVLAGTLYARYYDLPAPERWSVPPKRFDLRRRVLRQLDRGRRKSPAPIEFGTICVQRSQEAGDAQDRNSVAGNGTIIEQSQILTTHNLAVLVQALDLHQWMAESGAGLAERALTRAVRDLVRPFRDGHSELITLKNAAYAWRQAIFFLSFSNAAEVAEAVQHLRELLADSPALEARFRPAVDGLARAAAGASFDADGRMLAITGTQPGRRLLGWSEGRHWLAVTD